MNTRAIFLDYDNTVNDSDGLFSHSFEGFCGQPGKKLWTEYTRLHDEVVHRRFPQHHEDIDFHLALLLKGLGRADEPVLMADARQRLLKARDEIIHAKALYKDAIPFVEHAVSAGYSVCLTTGDFAKEKAHSVEQISGRKLFSYVFDMGNLGVDKGDAEYFPRVLGTTGVLPENACVVGDSPVRDIAPAKVLGIKALWVARNGDAYPRDAVRPDYSVRTLSQAWEVLSQAFDGVS